MTNQTQIATEPSILLTLSQDEVAFLLHALGVESIPSFTPPSDFDASAASAASRSLRARGVAATAADGKYQINEGVAAIVAVGAAFTQMLAVIHQTADGSRRDSWIYIAPGLSVLHQIPQVGVHTFQTLPNGMAMLLALAGTLELRSEDSTLPPEQFMLATPIWTHARDLIAAKQSQVAYDTLLQAGASAAFAQAAINVQARSVVSIVGAKADKTLNVRGLLILDVEQGYWLLRPHGDDLIAETLNGRKVLDAIADELIVTP